MGDSSIIRIAAAAVVRSDGATLLVRKRGTSVFMQPGGKIDSGEEPLQALCRELVEELGLRIDPSDAEHLGCYAAPAANEAGRMVVADVFRVATDLTMEPAAEIDEICWFHAANDSVELAPLTRDHVLPLVAGWKQRSDPVR